MAGGTALLRPIWLKCVRSSRIEHDEKDIGSHSWAARKLVWCIDKLPGRRKVQGFSEFS